MRQLPISISDFAQVRRKGMYYVDKSLLIRDLIDGAGVCLFARPRRFGKTLNMSMLRYFYGNDGDYRDCFEGLAIMQAGERYLAHMGAYPLVFFSLKEVRDAEWDGAWTKFQHVLSNIVEDHQYLLDWPDLPHKTRSFLHAVLDSQLSPQQAAPLLKLLSDALHRYHQKEVVIIIDEYDSPVVSAYLGNYYEEMIAFMRDFLGAGLKDNVHLAKGVLSGIMRITKESIFSGLNNPGIYSLLTHRMAGHFGFTPEEVQQLLADAGLNGQEWNDIQDWYNGYRIGDYTLFNPWSILNYVDKPEDGLRSYWAETSTNDLLKQLFFGRGANVREDLEALIRGDKLRKVISDNLIYGELVEKEDTVWSLLLSAGYLRAENPQHTGSHGQYVSYELSIPNKEILAVYETKIRSWLQERTHHRDLDRMLDGIRQGSAKEFYRYLRKFALGIFSYYDVPKPEPENFYHAFLLGLLVYLSGEYDIRSNREAGYGRFDLMLLPKDKTRAAIIIELKSPDDLDDETLEEALQAAITQLKTKQYQVEPAELGYTWVERWALAVQGKEVKVQAV